MTDLGLEDLTDDQLMELLNGVCLELAVRDPTVRTLAQGCIKKTGELLPEIRRAVKDLVEEKNGEELEEEDEQPKQKHGRRRKNPSTSRFTAAHGFGQAVPGSVTVPQNPMPGASSLCLTIKITVPVGYDCSYFNPIRSVLKKIIGREPPTYITGDTHTFTTTVTHAEWSLIQGHQLLSAYHIVVI